MKHVKNILSVLVVVAGLALCIYKVSPILRPIDTDGAYYQIETLHSLPENSLEVIIYGSSHAFRGVKPMEMYEKYGIGVYNYAWHWQKINTSKLFLQDSLLEQKPKVAVIETYHVDEVLEDTDIKAEVFYSRYVHDKRARSRYLRQCMGKKPSLDRRLSYFMPFALFHDNWSNLNQTSYKGLQPGGSSGLRKSMGFRYTDEVEEIEVYGYHPEDQKSLSDKSLQELDEIVDICKANDIAVVFYVAPMSYAYAYSDAMEQYAAENGCAFLDLTKNYEEVGLDGKTDYFDKGHLNISGANKVADYVGKYLKENYDLTDMRTVKDNIWEKALQEIAEETESTLSE